jgi:hypothetical protein
MKTYQRPIQLLWNTLYCIFILTFLFGNNIIAQTKVWHIKAVHPEGRLLDIKAFDSEGERYDVKAFEKSGNVYIMDIKALYKGQEIPVKMLYSEDKFAPVKAIGEDGTIFNIKAITEEGDILDIKGVNRSGNIIHIKAISKDGGLFGVKAVSPRGNLMDVKGVKFSEEDKESEIAGIPILAHIKALPQRIYDFGEFIWHVKAIHSDGQLLPIKAVDKEGNKYDVKALEQSGNLQLLDIKAFIGDKKVPVKVMFTTSPEYAPVKAIDEKGTKYDLKSFGDDGKEYLIIGTKTSGNITHIKASIPSGGYYGVKAISPEGHLMDIKGIKMTDQDIEAWINGVPVYAHVKALPQVIKSEE